MVIDLERTIEQSHFAVNKIEVKIQVLELGKRHAICLKLKAVFGVDIVRLYDPQKHELLPLDVEGVGLLCDLLQSKTVPLLLSLSVDLYQSAETSSVVIGHDA